MWTSVYLYSYIYKVNYLFSFHLDEIPLRIFLNFVITIFAFENAVYFHVWREYLKGKILNKLLIILIIRRQSKIIWRKRMNTFIKMWFLFLFSTHKDKRPNYNTRNIIWLYRLVFFLWVRTKSEWSVCEMISFYFY